MNDDSGAQKQNNSLIWFYYPSLILGDKKVPSPVRGSVIYWQNSRDQRQTGR